MLGTDIVELKVMIDERMGKLEEMLKKAVPVTGMKESDMLNYANGKLNEVGCRELPISEMFTTEDWDVLMAFSKEDHIMTILYALYIGFANGVKWQRE